MVAGMGLYHEGDGKGAGVAKGDITVVALFRLATWDLQRNRAVHLNRQPFSGRRSSATGEESAQRRSLDVLPTGCLGERSTTVNEISGCREKNA